MDIRKIVVLVEDVDVARAAFQWALHNFIRNGDLITLLHVFPPTRSRSKKKSRVLRLEGFQLALSFKDICNNSNVSLLLNTQTKYDFPASCLCLVSLKLMLLLIRFAFKLISDHRCDNRRLGCRQILRF